MKYNSCLLKQAARLLFSVAALLAGGSGVVRGQSALDGFDPNANGLVRVVVVQPDGKILIGGDFTTLAPNGGAPVTRNRIARLNPDGTLDAAFNPNASSNVLSLAVQTDGRILAGGAFTSIGSQPRNRMARLDATTGLADAFDPNANNNVQTIAMQGDGKILAGGNFTSIGGQPRNRMARLDATTGLADAFDPNANDIVYAITVQPDGRILVGGTFNGANSIGGQTRNRIARLDANTGLADLFNPNVSSASGVCNIFALAVQADGKILAGGFFNGANSIGGQTRNYIARLDPTTGLADSFNPDANFTVLALAVQQDGKILVGGLFGDFFGPISIGGQRRNSIARLNAITGLADSFDPNPNNGASGAVYTIAVQADGKILAGGTYTTIVANGGPAVTRNNLARLETDGGPDKTFNLNMGAGIVYAVYATAVQRDGKILIGGHFNSVLGVTRNHIARLNMDGTLDTAFNPNAKGDVIAITVQADGKILVGGLFVGASSIGGQTRNYIARLDPATGLADSFNPNANDDVHSIAVQPDGKILVGGLFNGASSVGGQTRNRIARLDPTTGLADSFNPNASSSVYSIAVQPDGKILAVGTFNGANSIGGQPRNRIARLDPTTGLADSFDPNANNTVYTLVVQTDGKILVGGLFNGVSSIGGQTRNYIARLDPITGLADSLNPNANNIVLSIALQTDGKILVGGAFTNIGAQPRSYIAHLDATTGLADSFDPFPDKSVLSVAVQADGKILAGGYFTAIGGQTRSFLARLKNDTLAVQNLAVTQTSVTWTRSGSSPQCARVTFEDSTDGVTYNFLGHGTAVGNNWTLPGLNLSIGQNIYIRARGYYRSGQYNAAESITESVRNVFLTPFVATSQPLLNIQRSANANVVLSWATNSTGFTLEANTNLSTNVWSVVSPAPSVSGTNNVVTNTTSSSTRFYRLRK